MSAQQALLHIAGAASRTLVVIVDAGQVLLLLLRALCIKSPCITVRGYRQAMWGLVER